MRLLKTSRPPAVVDVRKRPAFEGAPSMLPGAVWRDPHAVEQWAAELPSGCPIVVYCVHGHEVSRGVRDALRRRGVTASIIEGGIEAWRAAGACRPPQRETNHEVGDPRAPGHRPHRLSLADRALIHKEAEFLFVAPLSTAERKCIAVAEQRCIRWRDEKGPARGPSHLAVSRAAVGWRRTWASADGACSAGDDSSHRSSRGCGRDG